MSLIAKTVVKNKYWIVEKDGKRVATIQTTPTGVSFVSDGRREPFLNINAIKAKYSIVFNNDKHKKPTSAFEVNDFPCDQRPYNALFNVTSKLPVFTKTAKSKSFYCAGHYLVKMGEGYVYAYCPKLITLNRYPFAGPFKTKQEVKDYTKTHKE